MGKVEQKDRDRLSTFSFPTTGSQSSTSIKSLGSPLYGRFSSLSSAESQFDSSKQPHEYEKDFYFEESQGEAIFNKLKTYSFSEDKDGVKTRRNSSAICPKKPNVVSPLRIESNEYTPHLHSHSHSLSHEFTRQSGRRKSHHRKSNAISFSKSCKPDFIDEYDSVSNASFSSRKTSFASCFLEKESRSPSSTSYTHQESPQSTIMNTNEQLRRNASGKFGSLKEFAKRNQINIEGKVFAHKIETGDILQPLIDLDIDKE
ncbi:ics2p [Saccharomyces arboricola H-6]|uniref:Ics2p n=1 Tax=Saccharomyces arboricola (strain H-6 / AS 2.3317 / CBS 10644) TaxID=1160507 RepID=J8Q4Z4_SACAR|nr:ics2p [Saccharomyces arboricola H-6]